ncbi:hypothetical protein F5I97DRAFT_1967933 [Phlebopus sp. FC_14]|nr:hypothetical protein F5I97DRAFT_1967933 [Phlebopus sp. FC_14]
MPSFSSSSSIRATSESLALTLKVTHNLAYGLPADKSHKISGRLPRELDVLWLSDIVIKLTGSLDEQTLDAAGILRSGLLEHLQNQLRAPVQNAGQLGLNNVSRPYIDEEERCAQSLQCNINDFNNADHKPAVTLTPSRSLPCNSRPHVNLVSLHLGYTWKTTRCKDVDHSIDLSNAGNPFSPKLYLPVETLLTRVTEQFFIYHLVGRYPLIFGPWCKRLDLEKQYFPSIACSIVEIMNRSQDAAFVSRCKRLLKVSRSRHNRLLQISTAAISSCIGLGTGDESEAEIEDPPPTAVLIDEEVICESLEQIFRVGAPQRRFKPKASYSISSLPQEDDDDLVNSSQSSMISDAGSSYPFAWLDLPDIDVAHRFSVDAQQQTLGDTTEGFLAEEWPEDDDLSLMSEDTSPSYTWQPLPSDRSLISSIHSSSITTPSQVPFFTHYHDNEVDCHSSYLGPGMSQCGLRGDFLEDTENSAVTTSLASLSHHAAHDLPHSQNFAHLTLDQDIDVCRVASEDFAILDVVDSPRETDDAILFSLDEMLEFSDVAASEVITDVEVHKTSADLVHIDTDCFLADLWDL